MGKKELKTNAMRILDKENIRYEYQVYECEEFVDGIQTADILGIDHKIVYKTLVTVGRTGAYYVFVIPIEEEIDLKKAAKSVGEKSMEMLPLKDLTPVTGYVRGGCTAIGMKKKFPTYIHESAANFEEITVSSGTRGAQLRYAAVADEEVRARRPRRQRRIRAVPPPDDLGHAPGIVRAFHRLDPEMAVVPPVRHAVHGHNERCNGMRSEEVGYVHALDHARRRGEPERGGKFFKALKGVVPAHLGGLADEMPLSHLLQRRNRVPQPRSLLVVSPIRRVAHLPGKLADDLRPVTV